jgi:hypothetical protein
MPGSVPRRMPSMTLEPREALNAKSRARYAESVAHNLPRGRRSSERTITWWD